MNGRMSAEHKCLADTGSAQNCNTARNVLMIAYGYAARDVSESHTAHSIAAEVARRHRVTVLTRDKSDSASELVRVVSIPTSVRFMGDHLRRALKPDYFAFNFKAWRLTKSGQLGAFDLCHHVSPISLRYPDILARLPIPFIWGPVGGSLPYPAAFKSLARTESALQRLRVLDAMRMRVDPILRMTMARARAIIVTSRDAAQLVPARYQSKTQVIGEGVDATVLETLAERPAGLEDGYVFSSARLVPSKGVEFLLRAFAQTSIARLVITGDGASRQMLQRVASELEISSRVDFLGAVSKETNLAIMASSRFCVFPSLKEAFGHVNLEAMALGKAVVAVAAGGPRDIILDGVTGLLIDPRDSEYLVTRLAAAMNRLDSDSLFRDSLGHAGYRRVVDEYSWKKIGQRYLDLYDQILEEGRTASVQRASLPR